MPSPIVIPPQTSTFRDSGYLLSPQWLKSYWSSRFMYTMWVAYDALTDAGGYAVLARFPAYAPSDALPYLAQDRQIVAGYQESSTSYVARLIQWLDLWRHAGSSTGLLLAMRGYVSPLTPEMITVQSAGDGSISAWDTYDAGEEPFPPGAANPTPPDHTVVQTANWQWDGASQPYYYPHTRWRKWIVIQSSGAQAPWTAPTETWAIGGSLSLTVVGDATYGTKYANAGSAGSPGSTTAHWGDGTCWGWAGTAQQSATLTQLARQWKSAGCWIPWILVSYDSTMFDETQSFGSSKLPDGHWGYYGKVVSDATYGTKYVAARPPATTVTMITGTSDGGTGQPLGLG